MSESNMAVLRNLAAAFNRNDMQEFKEIYTPDANYYGTGALANAARDEFVESMVGFRAGFPDAVVTVDDLFSSGDKVAYRMHIQATNSAEFMGMPPTNKSVSLKVLGIARVSNGKIFEEWEIFDELGMMQQLGLIPEE